MKTINYIVNTLHIGNHGTWSKILHDTQLLELLEENNVKIHEFHYPTKTKYWLVGDDKNILVGYNKCIGVLNQRGFGLQGKPFKYAQNMSKEIVTFRHNNYTVIIEHLEKYVLKAYHEVDNDLRFTYQSTFTHFSDALVAKDKFFDDYAN